MNKLVFFTFSLTIMIARDGASESLWQHTVTEYVSIANTRNDNYDVIIVGGGITGISLGLSLQEKGVRCIILEANNICFGTTGGTTAHINTLLDTPYNTIIKNFGEENAKLVAEAVKDALALIRSNIETYNIDCGFEETPAYMIAQDHNQVKELDDIFKSCSTVNVGVTYRDNITAPLTFIKAMEIIGQAKFSPVQYVHALASAFEKENGVIVQDCRVMNFTHHTEAVTEADIVKVETSTGSSYYAKALVFATHIPMGVNQLHFMCAPYRSYALAAKLNSPGDYPEELIYDMYDPYHYYRTQEIDGENYFIAGGEDHKTAHETNTQKRFHSLEAHVRKHFNIKEITHRWSSQYYEPADGLPYIGAMPGERSNVYVATGYGGNGITYSNVAVLVLTDMIMTGKTRYENVFSPARIKPLASFSNLVKENVDVVKNFISKWFSANEMEFLSDLAKGEARITEFKNQKIAVYKDELGTLHVVNPTCTHLKCNVSWNMVEQSWDCPCHGARYNINGEVLNGPARLDLEQIHIRQLIAQDK